MKQSRTHMLVLTGLAIALIAAGAFITIPLGPVPFTLHTLMIGIVVCLLPPKYAVYAVGGYLLLGCLGLPVFSGFRGGIGVLAGPTGGFLVGFFLASIVIALMRSWYLRRQAGNWQVQPSFVRREASAQIQANPPFHKKRLAPVVDIVSLLILSVVYYTFGCLWFMISTGASLEASLAACVIPFVIPDIIKAVAAFFCTQAVCAALGFRLATGQNTL